MTTLESLAERIAITSGIEDGIAVEALRQSILGYRQLLISQNWERTRTFRQQHIITLEDLKLEKAEEGNNVYYSSSPLPKPLLVNRREYFISVFNTRTVNRIEYGYVTPEDLENLAYRRFTSNAPFYTVENDVLKLFNGTAEVSIRDVWEDPLSLLEFSKKCNCVVSNAFFDGDDLVIEKSMEAKILSFFGNGNRKGHTRKAESEDEG